jgi:hypothetical protein
VIQAFEHCMSGVFEVPAEHFIRTLLALSDLELRIDWFATRVQSESPDQLAPLLDFVIRESERAEPRAREALLTIALWTAGSARPALLDGLRRVAFDQKLLSLQRVIRHVSSTSLAPDLEDARVPDYGAGRELTLGERRSLARRSGRQRFDALIKDPHPMVIRELLVNPKTTEDDVVRLAAVRPARHSSICAIAATRWLARPRVRMSVLLNPGTPGSVALPLVGLCTRSELRQIMTATDIPTIRRITAGELSERRPPLGDPVDGDLLDEAELIGVVEHTTLQ